MRVPLVYRDATGELIGELETDGRQLAVVIDGIRFTGMLDGLEPAEPIDGPSRFVLASGSLCDCRLVFALPITVLVGDREVPAAIGVELELGPPRPDGGIEREVVRLELIRAERRVSSSGRSGVFEDELVELQRACPDVTLKTCFGCAFSDYSPYGNGLFGTLMCFRGHKAEYRAVRTKQDLFAIPHTELVQETHVCGEFEVRTPNTGYRG